MSEFADRDHQLFRPHFLNADLLADRAPREPEPEPDDAATRVEPVEKEVDSGWLNVRVGDGEWASARELRQLKTDGSRQGRIADTTPPTEWSERPSYADPVADGMDPTAPDSPESRF